MRDAGDMRVGVARHFMYSSATDVLFLERLMPQRHVRRVVPQERRINGHPVIDHVSQAVDDVIVALVNVKFQPVLAFLGMPKLVQRR